MFSGENVISKRNVIHKRGQKIAQEYECGTDHLVFVGNNNCFYAETRHVKTYFILVQGETMAHFVNTILFLYANNLQIDPL